MAKLDQDTPPEKAVADPETYRNALDGWLQAQMPQAENLRVHSVDMPKSTGFSNETVFFSADWQEQGKAISQRFVARIEPADGGLFPIQTPACEISCELQHRIMQAVADTGQVPMPDLLPFEKSSEILGRPFFVMSFVDGQIPNDVPRYTQQGFLVDQASPQQREQLVRDSLETMAVIAKLDWQALGLDWLDNQGKGQPVLADQLALYRQYVLDELGDREHPVIMTAFDWLDRNAPDLPVGISWGDSRIGNMIYQDYRCAAVCDWEAVSLCPPEADIGWFVMFDRQSFDDMDTARMDGYPTREQQVAIWEQASGRKVSDTIDYWEIFATMRFDAIMVKLGDRLARHNIVPAEANLAIQNGTTDSLAALLKRQGVSIPS